MEINAGQFNERYEIGTPLLYFPVIGCLDARKTKSKSEAYYLNERPVVQVEGILGAVPLKNVELFGFEFKEEKERAMAIELPMQTELIGKWIQLKGEWKWSDQPPMSGVWEVLGMYAVPGSVHGHVMHYILKGVCEENKNELRDFSDLNLSEFVMVEKPEAKQAGAALAATDEAAQGG